MGPGQAKQCQLRNFLTYYINDLFLSQVRTEINKEIETVTKVSDPLKILASADTMKVLGVQRPLLQVRDADFPPAFAVPRCLAAPPPPARSFVPRSVGLPVMAPGLIFLLPQPSLCVPRVSR